MPDWDRFRTERVVAACRWALVLALTGLEVATLTLWLALVDGAAPLSRTAAVGVVVLVVGLQVEHFLTDLAANGSAVGFPLGRTLAVSVTEALLWIGWFAAAKTLGELRGVFVAGVAFAVALAVQHTVEANALRGRPLAYRLLDSATVGFSLLTAAGASLWLALSTPVAGTAPLVSFVASGLDPTTAGGVVLAAALLVERLLVVRFARRERSEHTVPARRARGSWSRAR
ncbi:hypothetical protein ACFQMA_10130 [Halosimplex aquaticum]|uniref:HXXEE domain-containing protein n=1 Tax=Halosimplex aquaticum TaxID=3026162 RepID=A0ABD5XYG7_9EURY|nr:hypothetical protein [Halosimplex aquaticum]